MNNNEQQYRRICIMRCGYAVVRGNTDDEAIENAKALSSGDFDWEPVNADLIEATADIMEQCGPGGESLD